MRFFADFKSPNGEVGVTYSAAYERSVQHKGFYKAVVTSPESLVTFGLARFSLRIGSGVKQENAVYALNNQGGISAEYVGADFVDIGGKFNLNIGN